jgi:hypothetical protein
MMMVMMTEYAEHIVVHMQLQVHLLRLFFYLQTRVRSFGVAFDVATTNSINGGFRTSATYYIQ